MGKDFRPIDCYLADKKYHLRNILATNLPIQLQDPEAKALYPELSFLFSSFKDLFRAYKSDPVAHSAFKTFETALISVEKQINGKKQPNKKLWRLNTDKFYSTPVNDVVHEWFYGQLDKNFYYCSENDYQLECYMMNYIETEMLKACRKDNING